MRAEPAASSSPSSIKCQHCDPLLTLLASSWPCHRCSHSNDSSRNKKCCSSCRAWRDGLAPQGRRYVDVGSSFVASSTEENGPPNNVSPRRDGSPTKSRGGTKRKSPYRGSGGVLCPSTPPSPPALRPMRRITASPSSVEAFPTASLDRHLPLL